MNFGYDENGFQKVLSSDYFHYDCTGCGDCCRNIKDSVMVESLDLFRLARFFGMEMRDVVLQYKPYLPPSRVYILSVYGVIHKPHKNNL